MADPIRFYFDFSSTFSYIAVAKIDDLAAKYGRTVIWNAVSLGHLFQNLGVTPPPFMPVKFAYLKIDFARSCKAAGLPMVFPEVFPPDVKLARYVFWRLKAKDEALSHAFARAAFHRQFGQGLSIATADDLVAACDGVPGVTRADIEAAATDTGAKRSVIKVLEEAGQIGMVGAPYMIADGEPFWGADRLGVLAEKLAQNSA